MSFYDDFQAQSKVLNKQIVKAIERLQSSLNQVVLKSLYDRTGGQRSRFKQQKNGRLVSCNRNRVRHEYRGIWFKW